MKPTFFRTPGHFRKWLEKHHATATELLVGFYKKSSGEPSLTWPESVDEALCFGWIDGIRRTIDDRSYTIRFTPRRSRSIWSAVNIRRIEALQKERRMTPAGLSAFEKRREDRSRTYAYEQRPIELDEPYRSTFKKHKAAWEFFQAQPPSYRKIINWWIVSAKQEETRLKRLKRLMDESSRRRRIE